MLVDKRLWAGKMWKRQYHTNEAKVKPASCRTFIIDHIAVQSFVLTCDEEIDLKKVRLKGEGKELKLDF